MNWGVMLTRVGMQIQEQELRKMILARFDKALGTSRQLLTLVSTLNTDTWSSDKFRRMVVTSCVCIAAWMISILTTLSCLVVALCIVVVAIYMILGLMKIWKWLTCRPTDEIDHLNDVHEPLKGIVGLLIVVIHLEFFCLAISSLCIRFSSI